MKVVNMKKNGILYTNGESLSASGLMLDDRVVQNPDTLATQEVNVNQLLGGARKQIKAIRLKSFPNLEEVICDDFQKVKHKKFDYIVLNPPWNAEKGEKTWLKHLKHALEVCKVGVYLVCNKAAFIPFEHRVLSKHVTFESTTYYGKIVYVKKDANKVKDPSYDKGSCKFDLKTTRVDRKELDQWDPPSNYFSVASHGNSGKILHNEVDPKSSRNQIFYGKDVDLVVKLSKKHDLEKIIVAAKVKHGKAIQSWSCRNFRMNQIKECLNILWDLENAND